jgi:hypothetical protein
MINETKQKKLSRKTNVVNLRYGFEDENGKDVIPAIYLNVSDFSDGYAVVVDEETQYRKFIDTTGKLVLSVECDLASEPVEGKTIFQKNEKRGMIDITTGKIILPCAYDELSFLNGDNEIADEWIYDNQILFFEDILLDDEPELLIRVKKDHRYGLFDLNGKSIMSCKYDEIKYHHYEEVKILRAQHEGKWGVFDLEGKVIISCEYDIMLLHWDNDYKWEHHLFEVRKNGKSGVIGLDGKIILPLEYDNVWIFDEAIYCGDDRIKMEKMVFRVSKGEKMGVINWDGEIVLPCEYDMIEFILDILSNIYDRKTVIIFKKENKWEAIDY